MTDFKIKISPGELIDRLTILEIKLTKIKDKNKLVLLKREYAELNRYYKTLLKKFGKEMNFYKDMLYKANLKLWNTENYIRKCESVKDFGERFIKLARDVYITNDKRSALKSKINIITGSHTYEVKQYSDY
ncbi:MAG: DUF6165 family protein [Ignavibacteria bacterium]|nr:DUF6165 family protein [Ignavibacteria bacterium]